MIPPERLKAKRKVQQKTDTPGHEQGRVVEATGPQAIRKVIDASQNRSGKVVAAHGELVALLPKALHGMLPVIVQRDDLNPAKCDYSEFIEWIKLPRFSSQDTAHNWIKYVAASLKHLKRRVINCLTDIIESGAEPQHRQTDLFFAWWELQFMGDHGMRPMPLLGKVDDDGSSLLTDAQMEIVRCYPHVMEATALYRHGAPRLQTDGWNQRSVLSLLGYAVGWSGPPKTRRRSALEACLVLSEDLLPQAQREFWGAAGSRRRSRAMLRMITLFITLAERRCHGDWSKACDQWRDDAEWIEGTWCVESI
jgi:hypothetical protein